LSGCSFDAGINYYDEDDWAGKVPEGLQDITAIHLHKQVERTDGKSTGHVATLLPSRSFSNPDLTSIVLVPQSTLPSMASDNNLQRPYKHINVSAPAFGNSQSGPDVTIVQNRSTELKPSGFEPQHSVSSNLVGPSQNEIAADLRHVFQVLNRSTKTFKSLSVDTSSGGKKSDQLPVQRINSVTFQTPAGHHHRRESGDNGGDHFDIHRKLIGHSGRRFHLPSFKLPRFGEYFGRIFGHRSMTLEEGKNDDMVTAHNGVTIDPSRRNKYKLETSNKLTNKDAVFRYNRKHSNDVTDFNSGMNNPAFSGEWNGTHILKEVTVPIGPSTSSLVTNKKPESPPGTVNGRDVETSDNFLTVSAYAELSNFLLQKAEIHLDQHLAAHVVESTRNYMMDENTSNHNKAFDKNKLTENEVNGFVSNYTSLSNGGAPTIDVGHGLTDKRVQSVYIGRDDATLSKASKFKSDDSSEDNRQNMTSQHINQTKENLQYVNLTKENPQLLYTMGGNTEHETSSQVDVLVHRSGTDRRDDLKVNDKTRNRVDPLRLEDNNELYVPQRPIIRHYSDRQTERETFETNMSRFKNPRVTVKANEVHSQDATFKTEASSQNQKLFYISPVSSQREEHRTRAVQRPASTEVGSVPERRVPSMSNNDRSTHLEEGNQPVAGPILTTDLPHHLLSVNTSPANSTPELAVTSSSLPALDDVTVRIYDTLTPIEAFSSTPAVAQDVSKTHISSANLRGQLELNAENMRESFKSIDSKESSKNITGDDVRVFTPREIPVVIAREIPVTLHEFVAVMYGSDDEGDNIYLSLLDIVSIEERNYYSSEVFILYLFEYYSLFIFL